MSFTYDWFSPIIHTLERNLRPLAGTKLRALEIGSFEGRSTVWFLQNILTHEESSITCVDHFLGGSDHAKEGVSFDGVLGRFIENVKPFQDKIKLFTDDSWNALPKIGYGFDFVFVDGSHESHDVLHDAVNSYRLLKSGGLILFDDYGWGPDRESRPSIGIDAFLSAFKLKIHVQEKSYCVVVKKL